MNASARQVRWYQLPVLWLGVAILSSSLAACIALVIVANRHADEPLPMQSEALLKVPTTRTPDVQP
jgi:hypothetical protein